MSKSFVFVVLASLLFASCASASYACVGTPPLTSLLTQGSSCGGTIPCGPGLYCDNTGTCNTSPGIGGACYYDAQCPLGSSCIGKPGAGKCTAKAGPGDACDSAKVTNPACGNQLSCSFSTNTCTGGKIGDGCVNNTDCNSLSCQNGLCTVQCSTSFCSVNQYCDYTAAPPACTALPTSGTCTPNPGCAPGYFCAATDFTRSKYACLKANSVANGGWCENHHLACTSGLCWRGKCQANTPVNCNRASNIDSNTGCPYGNICGCDGTYLLFGYGTCKADACYDAAYKFAACVSSMCPGSQLGNVDYAKSCVNKNCQTTYKTYQACDPSNFVILSLMGLQ